MSNLEIVKLLIENKADTFAKDCDGRTALHKSVEMIITTEKNSVKYKQCLNTIKYLLNFNSNLIDEIDFKQKKVLDYYPELINDLKEYFLSWNLI